MPLFLSMLRSETAASPARERRALAGLERYQNAPRRLRAPKPARHWTGPACLRDHGGTGRPVVFVPSLINPPTILDLTAERSLVDWIAQAGFHAWLVDWGTPTPADRARDIAGHVTDLLLPLLAALEEPPVLVGYCLGGTMAAAAATLAPVAGLAMIAAPWKFNGYPHGARADITSLWQAARPGCEALGLVPMEVLQTGFWKLDPARTIAKYEAFADMPEEETGLFVAMEDWANAGAPLTLAAGVDLFDRFVAADVTGRGAWTVGGRAIDPHALPCPTIEFVSLNDRIVPAASAADLANRRDLGAGHVGMIVGRGARAQLWEPLVDWLRALPAAR